MDTATTRVLRKSRSHKEKSNPPNPLRSKSSRTLMPEQRLRLPWTQPDLLAERPGWVGGTQPDNLADSGGMSPRRMPAKVLVNVTVQGSLGPVQVMASMEWNVKRLVTATVQQYVKEGRRPQLPTVEAAAFRLHYSQFSLECLDPEEKIADLGSRNFFLCPRSIAAAQLPASLKEAERGLTLAPSMPVEWPKEAERVPASASAPAISVEWPKVAERGPASASAPAMPVEWPKEAERGPASASAPAMSVEWPKVAERGPAPAPAMPVEWLRFIVFVM